jgi:hypothetical protein
MSDTETIDILHGFLSEAELLAKLGRGRRTLYRMQREGLPFVDLHGVRFYPADKVRIFIIERIEQRVTTQPKARTPASDTE